MEKNNISSKELLKPIAIILLLALIGLMITLKNKYYLGKCSKYTIGKYTKMHTSKHGGASAWFVYKVDSKFLEEPFILKNKNRVQEKLLYLRYACDNPEIIEGIWDKKVDSTHLKNLPPDGWDKLPE